MSLANAASRWQQRAAQGRTDAQLWADLEYEIAIMGGSHGPGRMNIVFQQSGLKIWASWDTILPDREERPLFQGWATVKKARAVYGIADPTDPQGALF